MEVDKPARVDDAEEQQQEDRQDERELNEALPAGAGPTWPHSDTVREIVVEPALLVTVRVTVQDPLLDGKACVGFGALLDGVLSPNVQSQVVIGHAAGAVDRSVNVTLRRGLPVVQVKPATGRLHGVAVGVGVGATVGVGVGPLVGVGAGVGVGVGVAVGTVTVRIAVKAPPWFVTSRVTTYVPGLAYVCVLGILEPTSV